MQAEGLMQCLDSPLKQWCAFQIVFAVAGQGGMLYTEDAVSLSDGINANLDSPVNITFSLNQSITNKSKWQRIVHVFVTSDFKLVCIL